MLVGARDLGCLFVCLCVALFICAVRDFHMLVSLTDLVRTVLKLGQSVVPLFEMCPIEYQYVNRCSREKFEEALLIWKTRYLS